MTSELGSVGGDADAEGAEGEEDGGDNEELKGEDDEEKDEESGEESSKKMNFLEGDDTPQPRRVIKITGANDNEEEESLGPEKELEDSRAASRAEPKEDGFNLAI